MPEYTLVNDTLPDQHIGCDAVMSTIRRAAQQRGWHEAASQAVGQPITGHDYARLLDASDLVVINGEGTLHDDSRGCKNLAHFAAVAKACGKRVALLNASYSNNSIVTSQLFASCDVVAFRESHAATTFRAQVPSSHVTVTADFSLLSFPSPSRSTRGTDIGVTDSVLSSRTRELIAIGTRLGARYLSVKDHSRKGRRNTALRAAWRGLLTHCGHRRGAAQICCDVLRRRTREAFFDHAQGLGLLITGRFHAVMYCIASELPFLYLASNTDKIDHVLMDAGLDIGRRKLTGLADPRLQTDQRALLASAAFTPEEIASLRAYRQRYVAEAQALLDRVFC